MPRPCFVRLIIVAAVLGTAIAFRAFASAPLAGAIAASRITGYAALAGLTALFVVGTWSRWRKGSPHDSKPAARRRHCGRLTAELASAHALLSFADFLALRAGDLVVQPYLRLGLAAWMLLSLIWCVSMLADRRVKDARILAAVFVLAYPAAGLAFGHACLTPFGDLRILAAVGAVCLVVLLARIRWKRSTANGSPQPRG